MARKAEVRNGCPNVTFDLFLGVLSLKDPYGGEIIECGGGRFSILCFLLHENIESIRYLVIS